MVQKDAFNKIYEQGTWGSGTSLSPLSGTGSNPDAAKPYVDFVSETIKNIKISSVLDLGHGDWVMWRDYKFEDTQYLGLDVVQKLTTKNMELYGSRNVNFKHISNGETLPKAQLLICKDVLQHLSLLEIREILSQISKYQYVIFCNDIDLNQTFWNTFLYRVQISNRLSRIKNFKSPFYRVKYPFNNSEIETGSYRGIDLETPLFLHYFAKYSLVNKFDFGSTYFGDTFKRVYLWKKIELHN